MKLHHIGYLTNNIEATAAEFLYLGYEIDGGVENDIIQQCRICLIVHKNSNDCIELVEPFEDNAQMQKMLKKRGNSSYHICYEVDDVNVIYSEFCEKEGWMNIFKPVKAVALDNRLITYFYNINLGFVEFVNSK